ncbi:MAG: MmcQ/YjbR family DNA-binding protein [Firmicutes bacterium]|nr:MmcQ/YjbR family DNA-binding protein [Bacillota bacterium]
MTKEQLIKDCLQLEGSYLDHPYGEFADVIKNKSGKSFAVIGILTDKDIASIKKNCDSNVLIEAGNINITMKCPPELIHPFREKYTALIPGYYSNKNHWNTIILNKDVPYEEVLKMVQLSYDLVVSKGNKNG